MSLNLTPPAVPATTVPVPPGPPPPPPPPSRRLVNLLGVCHIVIAIVLFIFLFKIWPPHPWPKDGDVPRQQENIVFFGKLIWPTSLDERLILLVIVAGAIGSFIHSATSFSDYVGNRKFVTSWTWWYLLRSFVGVALALTFYFVVRAGFVMSDANDMSPFGIATLAALTGLFSKQATDKLEEVFTTMFRPSPGKGDAKRGDKLSGPTISGIAPREGPTAGGTEVVITGNGFVDKPSVKFGNVGADVTFVNTTTLKAVTPKHDAGEVEVVVINPDTQEGSPKERFTYADQAGAQPGAVEAAAGGAVGAGAGAGAGGAGAGAAGAGAGAGAAADESVDTIDGCDVDIIEETPDEDLPMAEGGVAQ